MGCCLRETFITGSNEGWFMIKDWRLIDSAVSIYACIVAFNIGGAGAAGPDERNTCKSGRDAQSFDQRR